MSVERHLIIQELILKPSGEWFPRYNGWTIARVAEGSGYWMQSGNVRQLNPGDGFVVAFNSAVPVRASQLNPLKLQFFTVQPQLLNGLLTVSEWHQLETVSHSASQVSVFAANEPIGQKFTHIANQTRRDELYLRCALLQLWTNVVGHLLSAPAISDSTNKLCDRFRQLMRQMLESELSQCSLRELAGKLHCSERHFSRLFRKEFGVPLRARQIELRLQRARQLLADSDAKVINVAYDSGYRHLGLFNAMFKKRFGMTPSEWRQQSARKIPAPMKSRSVLLRVTAGLQIFIALLGFFFGLPALAQTRLAMVKPATPFVLDTPELKSNAEPEESPAMAEARAALLQKMAELDAEERARKFHVVPVSTNGPHFAVSKYLVVGNSVLPPGDIAGIFTDVPAAFGTNVTLEAIRAVLGDLQLAYRDRGFATVSVGLPQQKLTNAEVKVQVTEGRLAAISVVGNRYYSSNNVMDALPDLHEGILLNAKIFQRELDLANASRDRQIYPVLGPGPDPGTSELTLTVKDRLPLHARLELNNQAPPNTPDLRADASLQYDNLWDLEHQIGLEYNFSIPRFKGGDNYSSLPFDAPQVANYSGYYQLPLTGYPSVQHEVDSNPGGFGYSEITHQFVMPAPITGRPAMTLYASRSTSDTGVQLTPANVIFSTNNFKIVSQESGDNFVLNENLGSRISVPLPQIGKINSAFSLGLDFKRFRLVSYNSNLFTSTFTYTNPSSGPTNIVTTVTSPQPSRSLALDYLPLNAGLGGSVPDKLGTTFFNISANFTPFAVFSKDKDFAQAAYTTNARANYVILRTGMDRQQTIYKNWILKLHADGQWADGALFGNEQFAMGGVAGVRGYSDGSAYGDSGWRVLIEPQAPALAIGMFGDEGHEEPCFLRSSIFMDYGELYRYVATGGASRLQFWGVGWAIAANIGTHLDARLSVAWPLISESLTTEPVRSGDTHIYFGIGAQF